MVASILVVFASMLTPQEPCVQETSAGPVRPASELSMEVNALQLLYDLQLTNAQLEKIKTWAGETAQKERLRKDREISKEFRAKLTELHKALAQAVDGEAIEKLVMEIEDLREKENPDVDDKVEISAAARKRTAEFMRVLQPKQVSALLTLDGEGIADPREKLAAALEDVRGLEGDEWKMQRDALASEMGRLVGGVDAKKYEQAHDATIVLLVKVRKLDLEDFQAHRKDLEKEAEKIAGNLGAIDFLRNYVEYQLAELLSNPRLAAAVRERLGNEGKEKRDLE